MTDTKCRIAASAAALGVTGICTVITCLTPIETTAMKVVGSFASVLAVSAAAWKFPKRFYYLALIFDFFADDEKKKEVRLLWKKGQKSFQSFTRA